MSNSEREVLSFFGAALKAIACTPNRGLDEREYELAVVEPTARIRALAASAAHGVSPEVVEEVLRHLGRILKAKRTPDDEVARRLHEVASLAPRGSSSRVDEGLLRASGGSR
ncbi:MAG: hypothetical protein QM820_55355 [Minicystis sp.]